MSVRQRVHADVLRLGVVSLLTDLSSEMIFSVFAVYFTVIAGGSVALLGLVEGLADFAACSLDALAGWWSDRTGRRRPLAAAGYGFSTLAKLLPLLSATATGLGVFRIVERLGKSLRGPPRDAWLAAIARSDIRGFSFGVHKSLDKTGAVVGPLCAFGLIAWWGDSAATYRSLLWIALVPAVLAVCLLLSMRDTPAAPRPRESPLAAWQQLTVGFKRFLAVAALFALGYFSFGFLLLRAHDLGFAIRDVVLLYAVANAAFVACAPAIGRLSDRFGRAPVLLAGYLLHALVCAGFAWAGAQWQVVALFVAYGVFHAIDEAQSKAFIADLEPERRGSAIGLYNLVSGIAYLVASLLAGALWQVSVAGVFTAAAMLALAATILFALLRPDRPAAAVI